MAAERMESQRSGSIDESREFSFDSSAYESNLSGELLEVYQLQDIVQGAAGNRHHKSGAQCEEEASARTLETYFSAEPDLHLSPIKKRTEQYLAVAKKQSSSNIVEDVAPRLNIGADSSALKEAAKEKQKDQRSGSSLVKTLASLWGKAAGGSAPLSASEAKTADVALPKERMNARVRNSASVHTAPPADEFASTIDHRPKQKAAVESLRRGAFEKLSAERNSVPTDVDVRHVPASVMSAVEKLRNSRNSASFSDLLAASGNENSAMDEELHHVSPAATSALRKLRSKVSESCLTAAAALSAADESKLLHVTPSALSSIEKLRNRKSNCSRSSSRGKSVEVIPWSADQSPSEPPIQHIDPAMQPAVERLRSRKSIRFDVEDGEGTAESNKPVNGAEEDRVRSRFSVLSSAASRLLASSSSSDDDNEPEVIVHLDDLITDEQLMPATSRKQHDASLVKRRTTEYSANTKKSLTPEVPIDESGKPCVMDPSSRSFLSMSMIYKDNNSALVTFNEDVEAKPQEAMIDNTVAMNESEHEVQHRKRKRVCTDNHSMLAVYPSMSQIFPSACAQVRTLDELDAHNDAHKRTFDQNELTDTHISAAAHSNDSHGFGLNSFDQQVDGSFNSSHTSGAFPSMYKLYPSFHSKIDDGDLFSTQSAGMEQVWSPSTSTFSIGTGNTNSSFFLKKPTCTSFRIDHVYSNEASAMVEGSEFFTDVSEIRNDSKTMNNNPFLTSSTADVDQPLVSNMEDSAVIDLSSNTATDLLADDDNASPIYPSSTLEKKLEVTPFDEEQKVLSHCDSDYTAPLQWRVASHDNDMNATLSRTVDEDIIRTEKLHGFKGMVLETPPLTSISFDVDESGEIGSTCASSQDETNDSVAIVLDDILEKVQRGNEHGDVVIQTVLETAYNARDSSEFSQTMQTLPHEHMVGHVALNTEDTCIPPTKSTDEVYTRHNLTPPNGILLADVGQTSSAIHLTAHLVDTDCGGEIEAPYLQLSPQMTVTPTASSTQPGWNDSGLTGTVPVWSILLLLYGFVCFCVSVNFMSRYEIKLIDRSTASLAHEAQIQCTASLSLAEKQLEINAQQHRKAEILSTQQQVASFLAGYMFSESTGAVSLASANEQVEEYQQLVQELETSSSRKMIASFLTGYEVSELTAAASMAAVEEKVRQTANEQELLVFNTKQQLPAWFLAGYSIAESDNEMKQQLMLKEMREQYEIELSNVSRSAARAAAAEHELMFITFEGQTLPEADENSQLQLPSAGETERDAFVRQQQPIDSVSTSNSLEKSVTGYDTNPTPVMQTFDNEFTDLQLFPNIISVLTAGSSRGWLPLTPASDKHMESNHNRLIDNDDVVDELLDEDWISHVKTLGIHDIAGLNWWEQRDLFVRTASSKLKNITRKTRDTILTQSQNLLKRVKELRYKVQD